MMKCKFRSAKVIQLIKPQNQDSKAESMQLTISSYYLGCIKINLFGSFLLTELKKSLRGQKRTLPKRNEFHGNAGSDPLKSRNKSLETGKQVINTDFEELVLGLCGRCGNAPYNRLRWSFNCCKSQS
jgi:hypothetical protein